MEKIKFDKGFYFILDKMLKTIIFSPKRSRNDLNGTTSDPTTSFESIANHERYVFLEIFFIFKMRKNNFYIFDDLSHSQ